MRAVTKVAGVVHSICSEFRKKKRFYEFELVKNVERARFQHSRRFMIFSNGAGVSSDADEKQAAVGPHAARLIRSNSEAFRRLFRPTKRTRDER